MAETYDLLILGGGPSGIAASIYAQRFRLKTLIIAKEVGGLITKTHLVENYPGFKKVTGIELMKSFEDHAKSLGAKIRLDTITGIIKKGKTFTVKTSKGKYQGKTILYALGSSRRKLGVPGEKEFENKGVSYCATCDAAFFKDKTVAVIGGSDSAAKESLLLADYCKKVYIIYRKEKLRAEPINTERVLKKKNIEIIYKTNITEIKGDKFVTSVTLDNPHKKSKDLKLDGVFIEIGSVPKTEIAKKLGAKLNKKGEIIADRDGQTNVEGFYAAGDCTDDPWKQIIIGSAQAIGATFRIYDFAK